MNKEMNYFRVTMAVGHVKFRQTVSCTPVEGLFWGGMPDGDDVPGRTSGLNFVVKQFVFMRSLV